MNRITAAFDNTNNYTLSNVEYDVNGNISKLARRGAVNETSTSFNSMDNLTYNYDNGNKLTRIDEINSVTYGFKSATSGTADQYSYEDNGNMTSDANKGITAIEYNHLNLPVQVTFGNNNIQYVYGADGTKLKKTISTTGTETLYAGGYIYEGNTLQFFPHPEGYITPDGQGGYDYIHEFRDHLDNIRLSYTDANGDGDITQNEIIKESNYYPFGLSHKGYNGNVSSLGNSVAKKYMFGGKEYQDELELGWYDVTARNYDPALGRWMNLDPLAEDMRRHSPYNYAFNNPISFIDPDGMAPWWINNGDGTWTAQAGDSAASLSEDAGISLEQANKVVESQLGENYVRESDGMLMSDVEVDDVVEFDVLEGDQTTVVVPDDTDIAENSGTQEQYGSFRDGNANKKAETAAAATIMIEALELANPEAKLKNKAIDVVAMKVFRHLTKVKNVKKVGPVVRSYTITTSEAPSTSTSKASNSLSPSQRKVMKKKAKKTLKKRKRQ